MATANTIRRMLFERWRIIEILLGDTPRERRSCREMHRDHDDVDQLDADERNDDAAKSPDEQVAAQERIGPERLVLDATERDRDEQRDDDGVEDDGGEDRRRRGM